MVILQYLHTYTHTPVRPSKYMLKLKYVLKYLKVLHHRYEFAFILNTSTLGEIRAVHKKMDLLINTYGRQIWAANTRALNITTEIYHLD